MRNGSSRGSTRHGITAASAAYLNIAVEPTPNSLRSSLALAIGRGSPRALGMRNNVWISQARLSGRLGLVIPNDRMAISALSSM